MLKDLRILKNEEVDRVIEHYRLLMNNHIYISHGFKQITRDEILSFIIRYIKPPLQHFKVIEDDARSIELYFIDKGIKRPLL